MSPRLPLEDLGSTAAEKTLLRRVGLLVAALVVGATAGIATHTWANAKVAELGDRVDATEKRADAIEKRLDLHLTQTEALRPIMLGYRDEERAARDAMNKKLDVLLEDCFRRGGCRR